MAETDEKEREFSGGLVETAAAESSSETEEPSENERALESSKHRIGTGAEALREVAKARGYQLLAVFAKFLKRTRRLWAIAAGVILGLIVLGKLVERMSERARYARERRHELAVASLTPERLNARCGQAAGDVTRELYPILIRTISYQPKGNERVVLVFTRTAEAKSDWVFLSIKDESGTRTFGTAEAQIAALSCLDSTK